MTDRTNQQKLDDIWWRLCTPEGLDVIAEPIGGKAAEKTLNTQIQRQGEGAAIGDGKTTLGGMVAWNDSHVITTISAVAASAAQSGASAEEIEAAVRKAMEEGVVKVDVSVATSPKGGN